VRVEQALLANSKGVHMYIGIGTVILIIILVVILM
jgi:hypothetical protein